MTRDLFPPDAIQFASTRSDALQQLQEFVPFAGRYSRHRNHVLPGHKNVSRLSPAIRHRLITEEECSTAPLERYAPSTIEKFTQEVYWRRYWKAWLSLRPQVWSNYLDDLHLINNSPRYEMARERANLCQSAKGPVALMNHFARELQTTGYLHNHARMWFAGWWIHVERLPWQLGAHFFFKNLLDADPASNTLSWRWVAGFQTPGKTYLPRRSNIEKYMSPDLLDTLQEGLEVLEKPTAVHPGTPERDRITHPGPDPETLPDHRNAGIWIHEEDLLPEASPLSALKPKAVLVSGNFEAWEKFDFCGPKRKWLMAALKDACFRAENHFRVSPEIVTQTHQLQSITQWARREQLRQVVALRPQVGPLADLIPSIRQDLASHDVELLLLDRATDRAARSLATGSFFSFWKKCQREFPELSA